MQCKDVYRLFVAYITHRQWLRLNTNECNFCWNDSELKRIWTKGATTDIKLLLMQLAGFTKLSREDYQLFLSLYKPRSNRAHYEYKLYALLPSEPTLTVRESVDWIKLAQDMIRWKRVFGRLRDCQFVKNSAVWIYLNTA